MRIVGRLDHGAALVVGDEEVVVVARQDQVDETGRVEGVVLAATRMDHRDEEIRPLGAQCL